MCAHHEAFAQTLARIEGKVDGLVEQLGSYAIVKGLVFGAATLILVAALGAIIALVIKKG